MKTASGYPPSRNDPRGMWVAVLAALMFVGPACLAATDISDIPMNVKNTTPPNMVFMIDNSGSMSNIVPESPYSASTTYLANCPAARRVPANSESNPVELRLTGGGAPRIQYDPGCASGCAFGTGAGQQCFDNNATYYAKLAQPTASYLPATYSGHYLNWYFGFGGALTGWTNRKPGTTTRMEIARNAAKAVVDGLPLPTGSPPKAKLRAALASYNNGNGGTLHFALTNFDTTARTSLKTKIDGLTPGGNTPLAETLADIGRYLTSGYSGNLTLHPGLGNQQTASISTIFNSHSIALAPGVPAASGCTGSNCPVQFWCQKSFAILITDGRPQGDQSISSLLCDYDGDSAGNCGNFDRKTGNTHPVSTTTPSSRHIGGAHSYESQGSDYLDDVAQALFEMDLRPDLTAPDPRSQQTKKNNLATYTVGFADFQAKNDPLLQETATQAGGQFYTADDTDQLKETLNAAVTSIINRDAAAAAVAVANTLVQAGDNIAYASSYNSGTWSGDLRAYSLDTTTALPIEPPLWSAQALLDARSPASRRIVTYSGSAALPFQTTSLTAAGLLNELATPTQNDGADVVAYLRGTRTLEGSVYRRRAHLLGDTINSEPMVIREPSRNYTLSGYGAFKTTNGIRNRQRMVYIGANDGMMHAFNATTGAEEWAYIPGLVLDQVNKLTDRTDFTHRYYVDGSMQSSDVQFANGGWHTVLVGSLGKGGRGFFAIDVTNPLANNESGYAGKVLWEFPNNATTAHAPNVGYSFGTPSIIRLPDNATHGHAGKWVALVTSGYNNGLDTNGDGNGHLFVLDIQTGAVLADLPTSVSGAPAGVANTPSGLTHVSVFRANPDTDPNARFAYGGDLRGNLWRFNLADFTVQRIALFRDGLGNIQPVSSAPTVVAVAGAPSRLRISVGTGLYLGDSDVTNADDPNPHATQVQTMYVLNDDTSGAAQLPNIRGTNGANCPDNGGDGEFVCQEFTTITTSTRTLSNYPMSSTRKGCYVDLPTRGERVVTHPAVTSGGTLVFTSNIPATATCNPGGSSWFNAIDASDCSGIEVANDSTDTHAASVFLGNALASRPVVLTTAEGKRSLIRLSDDTFIAPKIPEPPGAPATPWRRIFWRELN